MSTDKITNDQPVSGTEVQLAASRPSSGSSAGLDRDPNRRAPGSRPPSSGASSARPRTVRLLTIPAATLTIRPQLEGLAPDTPTIRRTRRKGGATSRIRSSPSGVRPVVGYPGELGVPDLAKRRSRQAIYLCRAEWAWTPHQNRLAAYCLSKGAPALAALARRSPKRHRPVVMGAGNRRLGVA